ncbi:MAG: alpha/beta fold hydrolase [Thermoleophilaceae bacterium]
MVVQLPALDLQVRQRQRALAGLRELLSALFFHGLAGSGSEWDRLQARIPARAPDLRPTGTRDEYVADAVALIDTGPVTLIGQSLGGHTAFLVAARRPDLAERLIVIEASPERGPEGPDRVRQALLANPSPYGSELDPDAAAAALAQIAERDFWGEWAQIRCPVLVVRGERGDMSRQVAERMCAQLERARLVEIPGAGHDVHLDQPAALAASIEEFVQESTPRTSST